MYDTKSGSGSTFPRTPIKLNPTPSLSGHVKKLSWLLRHSGQFDCRGWMEIAAVLAFLRLSRDALEAKQ